MLVKNQRKKQATQAKMWMVWKAEQESFLFAKIPNSQTFPKGEPVNWKKKGNKHFFIIKKKSSAGLTNQLYILKDLLFSFN